MSESKPSPSIASRVAPLLAALGIVVLLGFFVIRSNRRADEPKEDPKNKPSVTGDSFEPPAEVGFVGSQACAECHADLFESYRQHPMYNSTKSIAKDRNPPPSTSSPVLGTLRSLIAKSEAGTMTHSELMHDKTGKQIYEFPVSMKYVVGSGRKAKSYVHQREDLLCTSPLNFFTADNSWDLNPGFIKDDPRRFDRRAQVDCLVCHVGRLDIKTRGEDRFAAEPFLETAIGCERCHGPGEEHIAWHSDKSEGADPIVNPVNLEQAERDSVCYQCHFSVENRVLRPGRQATDFRPGMSASHVWSFFESPKETVDSSGRAAKVATAQVQQMLESRCYTASEGAMSCISCHDPHRVPLETERESFYRDRCFKCHNNNSCAAPREVRATKNDSCIQCHMPKRQMKRTTHASQSDHRILRTPAQVRALDRNGTIQFFDNHDKVLSAKERRRALVIATFNGAKAPYSQLLADETAQAVEDYPDDGRLLLIQGTIANSAGRFIDAIESFRRASKLTGSRATALESLTNLSYEAEDYRSTISYSDEFVKLNPYSTLVYALRADAFRQLGQPEQAIKAAQKCAELNPGVVRVHMLLRDLYEAQGMLAEQQAETSLIERLQNAQPLGKALP